MFHYLPVHRVRQGTHKGGVKVGDKQRRMLVIER